MNRMMIVASLAVLFLLPYRALSLGEGVSAKDARFEGNIHLSLKIFSFGIKIILVHTSKSHYFAMFNSLP